MASPLGTIYSRADALKRQLYDMLTNPSDAAAMLGGRIVESGRQAQALQEQTFADPNRPFRVTDPQAMARLTDMLMAGPMGFAPAGITAYHGSPYLFRQFDPTKVGTGEGAQAYGVGAGYTAEGRPVAETYRASVAAQKRQSGHGMGEVTIGGKPINWDNPEEVAAFELARHAGDRKAAADFHARTFKGGEENPAVKLLRSGTKLPSVDLPGYLYKGDIPDEILPKFLDWDKPFSKQTKDVQKAYKEIVAEFKEAGDPRAVLMEGNIKNDGTGSMMYQSFVHRDDIQDELKLKATQILDSKGVRGIRYLDQGSRGTSGQGTSNFIPFSPEDFKIQEINDIPVEDWISKGLL